VKIRHTDKIELRMNGAVVALAIVAPLPCGRWGLRGAGRWGTNGTATYASKESAVQALTRMGEGVMP
jgi:hypothetical protein